jgi:AraC-like DNA-binding protein
MAQKPEAFVDSMFRDAAVQFHQGGELTVAPDWAAPLLSFPLHLLYFVTEHGFVGRINNQPIRVEAGSLLWVMPNVMRQFWIEPGKPPFGVRWFRTGIYVGSKPLRLADDFLLVEDAWEAGQIMQQIVNEMPSNLPLGQARLRSLLILLFTSAVRLRDRKLEGGHSLSRSQRLKLTKLVRDHATGRLTPADLAAELDLSPDYFARLFRKSFGLSPRAWLVDQRIRHASAALVSSNRTVSQIALDYGYDDVFLFSRQFKQVMKTNPLSYRRLNGPV